MIEKESYPIEPMTVSIDAIAWLSGSWSGRVGKDTIEEHWSRPVASTMVGMFRWIREDRVRFYELTSIEEENKHLIFRIKHFNSGLIGWEEKADSVTFILVQYTGSKAVFSRVKPPGDLWMIYEKVGDGTMTSYFEKAPDSHQPEDEFRYSRPET